MDWSTLLGSSALASVVAFLFNRAYEAMAQNKKAAGILRGILLEIDHAEGCGRAYVNDSSNNPLWSPAYRIAIEFCQSGLAWLAAENKLKANEATDLHRYFICATELNRCLDKLADHCGQILSNPNTVPDAVQEQNRTRVKSNNLVQASLQARIAVKTALDRVSWYDPNETT